jgi:hypothetical protein
MRSPQLSLFLNFIKSHSKTFKSCDIVIFFDKEEIKKSICNSYVPVKKFKKLREAEKRMKKRNICFYYYDNDDLENQINSTYKFNGGKPKMNELYFKLDDYNESIVKYYTYDNFIRYSEDYNYDFFVYLFSYFGLKSMRWSYTNSAEVINKRDKNMNLGVKDYKIEFQFENEETTSKYLGIAGCKDFENNGAIEYFNCCERRAFWYSYCKEDMDIAVQRLLKDSKRYSFKYYQNNELLQVRLDNRLKGAKQICYEITNNTHHKTVMTKMIKISNIYSGLGIKLNNTNTNTKNYIKKYSINFWDVEDLESKTVEDIMNNSRLRNPDMNLNRVKSRFLTLNKKNINVLDREMEELKNRMEKEKGKSVRFNNFSINGITDYITKSWL